MPEPRSGHVACALDGKLYAIGSDDSGDPATVAVYDPSSDTWTHAASMTKPRGSPACGVLNGTLYVFGGMSNAQYDRTGETYDATTDTWHALKSTAPFSWGAATVVVNNMLYAINGELATGDVTTVSRYDPGTDTWQQLRSNAGPRLQSAVVAAGGSIYVLGGQDQTLAMTGIVALDRVDRYDIANDVWSTTIHDPAMVAAAGGVVDDRIYAVGIEYPSWTTVTESYDPTADEWATKAAMPTQRTLFAGDTIDGKLYIAGGVYPLPQGAVANDVLEIYSPGEDP